MTNDTKIRELLPNFAILSLSDFNKMHQEIENSGKRPSYIDKSIHKPKGNVEIWSNAKNIECLTYKGVIVRGKGLGAKLLHFPTANLLINYTSKDPLIPGVYGGYATIEGNAKRYIVYSSIGLNPHFEDKVLTLESHFEGLNESIYSKKVQIDLYYYLRPMEKYSNLEELCNAIELDVAVLRNILNSDISL